MRVKVCAVSALCILSVFGEPVRSSLGARNKVSFGAPAYDAEVEYLESSGTQYIDTGFHAVSGLGCRLVAAIPSGYGTWRDYYFFGWANDWQGGGSLTRTFYIKAWVNSAPVSIQFAVGDGQISASAISISIGFGTMVDIGYDAQNNVFSADGITAANPNMLTYESETRPVNTMPLFGVLNNNGFIGSAVRIREAKFFSHGQVSKDFVSVRFTNEIGEKEGAMFDRISGLLFRNSGTGAFIIGPDKE